MHRKLSKDKLLFQYLSCIKYNRPRWDETGSLMLDPITIGTVNKSDGFVLIDAGRFGGTVDVNRIFAGFC